MLYAIFFSTLRTLNLKQTDYLNPENTNELPLTEEERNATTINETDDEFQYTTPIKNEKVSIIVCGNS